MSLTWDSVSENTSSNKLTCCDLSTTKITLISLVIVQHRMDLQHKPKRSLINRNLF